MYKLSAPRSVRDDLANLLDTVALAEHYSSAGVAWRERLLGTEITTHLFLSQVLHGDVCCPPLARVSGTVELAAIFLISWRLSRSELGRAGSQ